MNKIEKSYSEPHPFSEPIEKFPIADIIKTKLTDMMGKYLSIIASVSLLPLLIFSGNAKSEESLSQLDREKKQFQELIRWKQPSNPIKLSIVEAMKKAETIPKVISYAYAIDSSLADLNSSRAEWWPTLSLDLSNTYIKGTKWYEQPSLCDGESNCITSFDQKKRYSYPTISIDLDWTFIDFTIIPSIKSDFFLLKESQENYDNSIKEAQQHAAGDYIDLQYAIAKYQSYKILAVNALDLYIKSVLLYESSIASRYDSVKQKGTLLSYIASAIDAIRSIHTYQEDLKYSIGYQGDASNLIPSEALDQLMNWKINKDKTLELAITNSNQLMAQKYLEESYVYKAIEYANEYMPTLGISLTGEVQNIKGYPSYSESYQSNYRSRTKDITGMITLEWDFFDGGSNWQTSKSYKAKAAQEKKLYKDLYDQLVSDTMISFLNVEDLTTEIMVNKLTVENGVQLLKMDSAALLYGVGDVTTITQDQANIVSETQTLLNNLSAYNKSIVDLVVKTGISIDDIKYGTPIDPIRILEQLNF